jgi:hypothetical protein
MNTSSLNNLFIFTNIKKSFNVHHLEFLDVDGRIILRKEEDGISWTEFIRLTAKKNVGLL